MISAKGMTCYAGPAHPHQHFRLSPPLLAVSLCDPVGDDCYEYFRGNELRPGPNEKGDSWRIAEQTTLKAEPGWPDLTIKPARAFSVAQQTLVY